MAQAGGGQQATGQLKNTCQILLVTQFIDGRPANHAGDGHLRAQRGHHQRVAVFQFLCVRRNATQQQVVRVHCFNQLPPVIMLQQSQRTPRRHASGRHQGVERRRQGTNVVCARLAHFSDNVDTHGAQPRNRNLRGRIAILCGQSSLHQLLHITQSPPAHLHGARFRQCHPALPVDRPVQAK